VSDPLDQLRARLAALEDERDITDTIDRYSHAIDSGDDDEWVDCFTSDGAVEVRAHAVRATSDGPTGSPHGHAGRYAGREQLREFIEAQSRPPEGRHKHVVSQTRITLEGDTATAVSYLIRVDDAGGRLWLYSMGRYVDKLVRSSDGRWRIAERIVELEAVNRTPG
jgi:3-phenylpropionate/cinnamic acid dioxygenase small subunit